MTQPQQQLQKHQHTQAMEMVLVPVNHQQLQLQKNSEETTTPENGRSSKSLLPSTGEVQLAFVFSGSILFCSGCSSIKNVKSLK